jgi:hypothetical protein
MSWLRDIGWDKVSSAAPALLERARGLWSRVAGEAAPAAEAKPVPASDADLGAALDVRIGPLERRVKRLEEEARASFEVVHSMADQHSQLVKAVDRLIARTQLLRRVCLALGAAIGLLVVVLLVMLGR